MQAEEEVEVTPLLAALLLRAVALVALLLPQMDQMEQ
jgi:hypothetical protein